MRLNSLFFLYLCVLNLPSRAQSAPAVGDEGSGFWDGGGAALIGALPTLIWAALIAWAIFFLAPKVVDEGKWLQKFKGLGFELEFALRGPFDMAVSKQDVSVAPKDRQAVLDRARCLQNVTRGRRILWVDDQPINNIYERTFLRILGIWITNAQVTDEAIKLLLRNDYDVIISDMRRGNEPTAGLTLVQAARAEKFAGPIIIYTGTDQSGMTKPADVFGITNRPDELFNIIFNTLELNENFYQYPLNYITS